MLTEKEILLVTTFMQLDDRERDVVLYLLMHDNKYIGTYSKLARVFKSDTSYMRKVILKMESKHYICNVKCIYTNKRMIWIDSQLLYKLGF